MNLCQKYNRSILQDLQQKVFPHEGKKMKSRRLLKRGVGWVLVQRDPATTGEREVRQTVKSSEDVFLLVRERILSEPVEVMYTIGLDGHNRVIAMCEVARGGLHGCSVYARDVLRPMVACGASAFVLVHNHPSGDSSPSTEDLVMTKVVATAADAVGIPLVDHLIIAGWNQKSSFADLGLL